MYFASTYNLVAHCIFIPRQWGITSKKETEVINLHKKTEYMTIDCLLIFISSSTYLVIDLKFNNPPSLEKISIDQDSNEKKYIVPRSLGPDDQG